jgi:hypothetical protein
MQGCGVLWKAGLENEAIHNTNAACQRPIGQVGLFVYPRYLDQVTPSVSTVSTCLGHEESRSLGGEIRGTYKYRTRLRKLGQLA